MPSTFANCWLGRLKLTNEPRHGKIYLRGFRPDTTQTGLHMARGLEFRILEEEGLHLCSERSATLLHVPRTADMSL